MQLRMLTFGIANGFLFVLFSAFGAHALKGILNAQQKGWFDLAADYQIIHALALVVCALWARDMADTQQKKIRVIGWFFMLGIVLFSGSLYAMSLGAPKWLAMFTPLGGSCLLVAWLIWFFVALKNQQRR